MQYLVELNYAGMPNQFKYVNFPRDPLDVSNIDNLLLHQYFYSHLLSSESVSGQFDLTESALTDGLAQQVVSNLFLFLFLLTHEFVIINLRTQNVKKSFNYFSHPLAPPIMQTRKNQLHPLQILLSLLLRTL